METIPTGLSVDDFLAWAESRSGRHELLDGSVRVTSPRSAGNSRTRSGICDALRVAVRDRQSTARMLPGGIAVRIGSATCLVPDASVYCGDRLDGDAIELRDPVAVFEALDFTPPQIDSARRLAEFMRLPSIRHVVVVDVSRDVVIHFRRQADETIITRILYAGVLELDPPSLSLPIADFFAED